MKKPHRKKIDELTAEMHYEFLSDEYTMKEIKAMGVSGKIQGGCTLQAALDFYEITEDEYRACEVRGLVKDSGYTLDDALKEMSYEKERYLKHEKERLFF